MTPIDSFPESPQRTSRFCRSSSSRTLLRRTLISERSPFTETEKENDPTTQKRVFLSLPRKLTVQWSPTVLEVVLVGSSVHLAVELGVDERTVRGFVERVRVVSDPRAGEQSARALVALEHGLSSVVLVGVLVLQAQDNG